MKVFRKFTFMFVAGFLPERFPRLGAAACLLALAFALLLGAVPALAHEGTTGHVHFEAGFTSPNCKNNPNNCPDRPTGYAVPGPNEGEITLHWSPATSGPSVNIQGWRFYAEKSSTASFPTFRSESSVASLRSHTLSGLELDATWTVGVSAIGPSRTFSRISIARLEPGRAPALAQVRKAWVSGSTLTLTFWGPLDEDSMTPGSAFKVWTTHRPPRRFRGTGTARISGNTVKVLLDGAIPGGPGVHMAYSMPSANRLRYASGHPIESFTDNGPHAFLLHNRGDRTPPTLLDVTVWGGAHEVSGSFLRLDFDELLNAGSVPDGRSFHITVNGERRHLFPGAPAHIQGATLRLWLNAVVKAGDRVEVSYNWATYRWWDHYGPLRDLAGNVVEEFSAGVASNAEGPPVFSEAEVNGTTLTLAFNEPLDEGSVSAPNDFHVTVGDARRAVATGGVAIDGATVALTLESAVAYRETGVKVRYTRGANPLRDRDGNEVAGFGDQAVTNVTPPGFRSAQVTGTTLTLLFDEALDRGSVPAPGDFHVTVGSARRDVAAGGVAIDGAKVRLTLVSPVSEENTVTVSYGKRENPLRDRAGNEIAEFSKRPVTWVAGPPVVESAEVNGATLTLTFDQDLDGGSVPAPGRFHVTVGGVGRNVASGGVAIDGATVTLTLATAVAYGETVMVRYTRGANPLRSAAGLEVVDFDQEVTNVTWADPEGPPGNFWSATLTVMAAGGNTLGCVGTAIPCGSALTEDSYDYEGISYRVVSAYRSLNLLGFGTNKEVSTDWTLHVGDRKFRFTEENLFTNRKGIEWNNPGFNWTVGDKVQLYLSAPADDPGAQANSGPSFHSAQVKGNQLTVSFDETLDEDSAPDGGAFRVRTLPDGGGTGRRSAQGQGGTSSGTGATSVEGRTVTVTLDRPVAPGDRVVVSYDRPDENPVRDESGDEAEGFSARPAANVPPVTAVAVVSDAGSDDTYALGDTIRVRVTFAEKVNVDTAGGTPRLTIKMDPTWGEFRASYARGSGRRNLIFTHTVVEPNTSPRGIAVLANTLELNGGTIRSKATGADADLAHTGLGHDAKHKVNWRIVPSDVTAVAVVSDAGSDDTYALGDTIRVRVTFAGKVNVDTAGGTPRLKIKMDPTWGEFWAQYAGGSGTASLTFTHTVVEPNTSPRGIAVLANTLQTGGGAIRLAATNANARLGHTGLGHDPAHKVNWRISPPVASTPPGAPTGVTVQGASNTGLSVSWTAPSDTGSAAIAGYELRWYAGASDPANASDWTETGDVGSGTSATIESLAADTAYRVQVRALGAGKGPWSSSGAGRTQAAGDTTPPQPESATVNWRAVTVTFDEDLAPVGAGASLHYYFKVKGAGVEQHPVRATASGRTVTMQLGEGSPARAGRSYTIGYSVYSGNGPLKDAAGNAVVKFSGLAAENLTQPRLSVADAKAHEGTDASMDFAVTLDAAMDEAVTVDYATADGSATAGEDYTATSGTLTFAAGERRKTVSVAILDDAIDEGKETFALRLSNAEGAVIEDGEATGTIINTDNMPRAWLARFGRAAAEHVTDAIGERLRASPGMRVTLGGQELDFSASANPDALTAYGGALLTGSDPRLTGGGPLLASASGFGRGLNGRTGEDAAAPVRELSMPDLLLASSFHMASASGGSGSASGRWSVWGRAARSSFEGTEGALTLEGDVTTATLGFDYERGSWLAGVALSRSSGEGSYEKMGMKGEVESGLTGVYPYARYNLSERLSVWGVVGHGQGDMTLRPEGAAAAGTDIETSMAAGGARGVLLPARAAGGFELALRADLMATATASDAASNLAETEVETSRLRLLIEASRSFRVGAASALAASVEAGLRYDGGDAETGSGLEMGGSLRWSSGGLTVEVAARGLMAHSEDDYEEWGVSGSVQYAQNPDGRGFSVKAGSAFGAAAGGAERLWSQRAAGLAGGEFAPGAGFDAEAGYGFGFRGGLLTPYTGVALSDSGDVWRAGARWKLGAATEVSLEASLRENAAGDDPESGVLLKGSRRW